MIVDIQAEDEDKGQKGTQRSLEVEIKWFEGGQDDSGQGSGGPLELG